MMQDLDNDMERLVGEAAMEAPSLFYYTQYDLEKSVQTYASYYIPITIIIIIIIIISNALIIKHHLISHHLVIGHIRFYVNEIMPKKINKR